MSERRGSNPSEVTDDSISITSTVDSEKQDEYVVEAIIAERENDGERQYLVRWEGYPDERCTWEPRSSFQNENTLLDWEAQKSRVSRGLAEPCNVEALLDRVEEWILSTNRRKLRRRAKRLRLGLAETAMETRIDEDDSYDEAEPSPMEAEHGLESPVRANALKSKGDSASEGRIRTGPKGKQPSSNRSIAPVGKSAGVWSEEEELALVEGLDLLKGPYFDQILDLYGPAGTVNQILKERTVVELQEKTRNLYEEFQEQGFEIPSNMHDVPGAETTETSSIQVPGKAPTAVMFLPQKRDNGAGGSKSTSASSNASPTKVSFGEAGKAPQRDRASGLPKENLGPAKSSPTQSEVGMSRRPSLSAYDSPGARPASKLSSASSPKPAVAVLRRTSQADPPARRKEPRDSNDPNPLSPRIENSRRASLPEQSSKPTATASKPPKRSGKTNLKEGSSRTRQLQMGSSGRGPARLDLSKRKYSTTVSKNVRVSGDAILRNWNKDLKGRKLKAIRPRINDKPAQKFSIMRRYVKAGRNEPAPNIEKLTFLNLKHGNVTKQPPLATPKPSPPTKTPFQLIQEGLKPSDDAPVGIESTDAPPLREQNLDSSISQRTTLDRGAEQTAKSEVSGSESKRTNTIVASPVDSPTDLAPNPHKRSLPDPQIQRESNPTTAQAEVCRSLEHLGHSEAMPASDNQLVPRGTRHDEGLFDADSSPYTSAPSREKSASTAQPGSGFKSTSSSRPHADIQTTPTSYYSTMTQIQRDRPTPAQEELMKKSRAEHDILGNIFVGHDSKDLGSVRFRGLDWHTKQLFLTIKVPPRQMHVRCGYICTVGEYQEFYRGVRVFFFQTASLIPIILSLILLRNGTTTLEVDTWYPFSILLGPSVKWLKFSNPKLRVLLPMLRNFQF
jgi:chromo domain-containing protein 1